MQNNSAWVPRVLILHYLEILYHVTCVQFLILSGIDRAKRSQSSRSFDSHHLLLSQPVIITYAKSFPQHFAGSYQHMASRPQNWLHGCSPISHIISPGQL